MTTPTLSYKYSVDVCSSTSGTSVFNVTFPTDFSNTNQVIMIDYVLTLSDSNNTIINDSVSTDSGFLNKLEGDVYTLTVPSPSNGTASIGSIKIRACISNDTNGVSFTTFSNDLDFYPPPPAPVIKDSYYIDREYGYNNYDDVVYVTFDETSQTAPEEVIIVYNYTDTSDALQYGSTDVMTVSTKNGIKYVVFDLGDDVKDEEPIEVAAYAVYGFDSNQYNAVSGVSDAVNSANLNALPLILDEVWYAGYESSPNSLRAVIQLPDAGNDKLGLIDYNGYEVQVSTSNDVNSTWKTIDSGVIPDLSSENKFTTPIKDFNDDGDFTCGSDIYVRVLGTTLDGPSPSSNVITEVYAIPAGTPTSAAIGYMFYDNAVVPDPSNGTMNDTSDPTVSVDVTYKTLDVEVQVSLTTRGCGGDDDNRVVYEIRQGTLGENNSDEDSIIKSYVYEPFTAAMVDSNHVKRIQETVLASYTRPGQSTVERFGYTIRIYQQTKYQGVWYTPSSGAIAGSNPYVQASQSTITNVPVIKSAVASIDKQTLTLVVSSYTPLNEHFIINLFSQNIDTTTDKRISATTNTPTTDEIGNLNYTIHITINMTNSNSVQGVLGNDQGIGHKKYVISSITASA